MCFGFRKKSQKLEDIQAFMELRADVRDIKRRVINMENGQAQVAADIADIKERVSRLAGAQDAALATAKAAWEADDEAKWNAAHADLSSISSTLKALAPDPAPAAGATGTAVGDTGATGA